MKMSLRWSAFTMLVATAYGHAGLIIPTTRNSIDRLAEGFSVDGSALGTPCTCAVSENQDRCSCHEKPALGSVATQAGTPR